MSGAGVAGLAAALAVASLLGGCGRRPPDVVLVVVDTLRADRVGAAGGRPGLTPFLDGLAAGGVTFTNAYSTSSWTNPAVATLFTSRYPSQHRVTRLDSRLGERETTLAETLGLAGYRRVGMVANFRLTSALGFGQGFDAWFPHVSRLPKVPAHRIAQDTIRFYDRELAPHPWSRWTRRPLFLYLHLLEPHAPYQPPAAQRRGRVGDAPPGVDEAAANAKLMAPSRWGELSPGEVDHLATLYDAEVAAADAALAKLFRRLARRGVLDRAVVVVTADHGEEFREHGGVLHGTALYEESVRVPLVMAGPGLPAGRVVQERVSLIDVAPTLLDVLGLAVPAAFEGRSLRPAPDRPAGERDVLLELLPIGPAIDVRRHAAGFVGPRLKILDPAGADSRLPEAYDLAADPAETRSDPPGAAAAVGALRDRLAHRVAELATRAAVPETVPLDPATRDRLRALGYAD